MTVHILIHATDKAGGAKKGFPQSIKTPEDLVLQPWGTGEGLPDFVRLTISDAVKTQVEHYLDNWKNEFTHTTEVSNAQGRRIRISVNPNVIAEFGLDAGIRTELNDYMLATYNAVLKTYAPAAGYATYDTPTTDWTAMEADLLDQFEQQLDTRRYHISASDIDLAIAAGGEFTLTTAQVLARVIDRLA